MTAKLFLATFLLLTACAHQAHHAKRSPQADSIGAGTPNFRPDITGMLNPPDVQADPAQDVKSAPGGDEANCKARVEAPLREMVFRHFLNMQSFENAHGHYFDQHAVNKWAHLLGMITKESAGDTNDVTDMRGKEFGTFTAKSTVARWRARFAQSLHYDSQTNWGLTQTSSDRLATVFKLDASTAAYTFEGREGNTAEDIRDLIRLYQGFAQSRITNDDVAIPQGASKDPNLTPELTVRVHKGTRAAVWHCGTRFLLTEGFQGELGEAAMEGAMASIAYCDIGLGKLNADTEKCYADWVTLCPALNIDIGLLTPDSYFATNKTPPACINTFNKLTTHAPPAAPK